MAHGSPPDEYTGAMRSIINGTSTGDMSSYREAAAALEDLADAGDLPRGD